MRVEALRTENHGETVRASAWIHWEDSGRDAFELVFEASGPAAPHLRADPNAILVAVALPALRHGERRIALEGPVCPHLAGGLNAAAALLGSWYGDPARLPEIEPAAGFAASRPAELPRAAAFLSGGVDSLDVFLHNLGNFPAGHPRRVGDALHVSGLPWTGPPGSPSSAGFVSRGRAAAAAIAERLAVPLTFVRTNLGALDRDFLFFRRKWFGSAYAAVAHLLSDRFTDVSYASAQLLGSRVDPLGSHPLLDPLYSTGALRFRHEGASRSRIEKARAAASRPDLLSHLHVCLVTPFEGPGANCGRCEKCLHTQIELVLAEGSIAAFPAGALTPRAIGALRPDPHTAFYWRPLSGPLRVAGYRDLAAAVERKVAEMDRVCVWLQDGGWKGRLRRFDRTHLRSTLLGFRGALRRLAAGARGRAPIGRSGPPA